LVHLTVSPGLIKTTIGSNAVAWAVTTISSARAVADINIREAANQAIWDFMIFIDFLNFVFTIAP
jgi:hypothetical protein